MPDATITRGEQPTDLVFVTGASVRAIGEATDDDLLALITKRAPNPSVFKDNPPYMFQAEASNSRLDAYYTRMDEKSLKNYAKDADAGVMFMDSHDKRQLGYGQSIRGQYVASSTPIDKKNPSDADPSRVLIDFYTIPGLQLGRASSDSFIMGVDAGIIRDVSIGFMPGSFECNLCGEDPYDWWEMRCMHAPGAYYDSTGKNIVTAKSAGAIRAFAWVRDARLSEVSAVYDGATPGAVIQKAHYLIDAGEVDRKVVVTLERQLRIKLPTAPVIVPAISLKDGIVRVERGVAVIDGTEYRKGMEVKMAGERRFRRLSERSAETDPEEEVQVPVEGSGEDPAEGDPAPADESLEDTDDAAAAVAADEDPEESRMNAEQQRALEERARRADEIESNVRRILDRAGVADAASVDIAQAVTGLAQRIADLEPRAALGDQWRNRVIDEALDAGVRALADRFKPDEYRETFSHMSVPQIELMRDSWEALVTSGKSGLPSGGRATADIGTNPVKRENRENGVGHPDQYVTTR